ncbi:MAG: RNA polymerase sigma factor [FCB group bacterium]|jgi:RNA polymerase sigma-70 factor (ECF subfamily)
MNKSFSRMSDEALYKAMNGSRKDAEAAFAEIYSRYSQRIYAYCVRVLGIEQDAQDAFQETFLKFYDARNLHEELDNIPGYLITIARRICINLKRDKMPTLNIDDYNVTTNDPDTDKKELMTMIAMALELLEFDQREIFILRQYQSLSYKEIVKITGVSESTLKNRYWRAKDKIKEILTPYMEEMLN